MTSTDFSQTLDLLSGSNTHLLCYEVNDSYLKDSKSKTISVYYYSITASKVKFPFDLQHKAIIYEY